MILRTLSVAELEAAKAALWYDRRRRGLGDDFLSELEHAFDRIRSAPESLSRIEAYSGPHEIRRCLLNRFPYLVIFCCKRDELVVVAVSHARQRPFCWLKRVK